MSDTTDTTDTTGTTDTPPTTGRRRATIGVTPKGFAPPGVAPTADEQWHYLATHLAAIRRSLAIIASLMVASTIIGVTWAFAVFVDGH